MLAPLQPNVSLNTEQFVESLKKALIGKQITDVVIDGDFYRIDLGDKIKVYVDHRIDCLFLATSKD